MRSFVVAVLLVIGCEGKQPASSPPARKDAAAAMEAAPSLDASLPTDGTGEPAPRPRPPTAASLREAALPPRTPCADACDGQHIPVEAIACTRHAQPNNDKAGTVKIQMIGERTKGACIPKSIEIDCCPSLKPTDYKGIAKRLGWQKATIAERKAIAWVIARVVVGGKIIDEDVQDADDIAMPLATERQGGLVLEFWVIPEGATKPMYVKNELTFTADGAAVVKSTASQLY